MIDKEVFVSEIRALERRFGHDLHEDEVTRYHDYLSERMSTDQFRDACRAVWATREFFPRPADFVEVTAGREWRTVIEAIGAHNPPHDSGWIILHDRASERSVEAVRALGGLPSLVTVYDRDPIRARKVWMEAYKTAVVEDAMDALPSGDRGPSLPPGQESMAVAK